MKEQGQHVNAAAGEFGEEGRYRGSEAQLCRVWDAKLKNVDLTL